jgi:hypothetical protein
MADNERGATPLSIVRNAIDNPEPAAKVGRPSSSTDPNEETLELPFLPPGCPVEPLGVNGQLHYYLDEHRQLIALKPNDHGKTHILALFGRKSPLCDQFWPRYSDKTDKDGKPIITGWKSEVAAQSLMRAAAMCGIFDPQGKSRGTGAHLGENGELVMHCGDKIYVTGEHAGYQDPGLIGGYVYPAGPSRPRPDPVAQNSGAGEILLAHLKAWSWFREVEDPMLALGWIGCALVGGALDWRPHAWITGGSGTGKSTLQKLLRGVFENGALTTGDATPAAVRQLLRQQTLPVFLDEAEPDEHGDNRKINEMVKLYRLASSGELSHRGGQDHQGHEFTLRSCFLFSSILLPPMLPQDRNRLAILELHKIPAGKPAPTIDPEQIRLIGRQLRRRLVDHWHRLDRLISRYKSALADVGHNGRSGDQFGTLLAVADLLLWDDENEENILFWADRFQANELAEKETDLADEEEIVQYLATSFLPQRGGEEPAPIVRHIHDAITPAGLDGSNKAGERLENFGLRIVQRTESGAGKPSSAMDPKALYLAIANAHVGLEKIFAAKRWSQGTWTQSFQRVDGSHRRIKVRFAGAKPQWSTLIPLSAVLELVDRKPEN